jgi:flagellar basal body-associated protein FliL
MLDSRDNSVLKSLKELRKQEEDRVKKERAEAEARAEAERRAKEESERRAKEAAERAKREEEERLRRIEEDKANREREERLRLEESERRARIEAETTLQQERMRLDAQVKSANKGKGAPMGLIVGIVVAVLAVAGGVIFKIKSDHQKQMRAAQAAEEAKSREAETAKLRLAEELHRFEQLEAKFKQQLAAAKNDAERAAIQKQLDDARATRAAHSSSSSRSTATKEKADKKEAPATAPVLIKSKKSISDDPLDGLKL